MLLVGVLFGLVTAGFVVPCLIDVAVTPAGELRGLSKTAWMLVIAFFSVVGAAAWLVARRPDRRRSTGLPRWYLQGAPSFGQQDAFRRHPATRPTDPATDASLRPAALGAGENWCRPAGPDDDEAFLQELARRIRQARETDDDC